MELKAVQHNDMGKKKKKNLSARFRGGNATAAGFRLRDEVESKSNEDPVASSSIADPGTLGLNGLIEMFGDMDRGMVEATLHRNHGDLEKCVLELSLEQHRGILTMSHESSGPDRESQWDVLPDDCKDVVFSFLSTIDKARAAGTSREFLQRSKMANWASQIACPRDARLGAVRGMVRAFMNSNRLKVDYNTVASSDPLDFYEAIKHGQDDRWATISEDDDPTDIETVLISGSKDFNTDELSCLLNQLVYIKQLSLKNCENIADNDVQILAGYRALSGRTEYELDEMYVSLDTLDLIGSKISSKGLEELISCRSAPQGLLFLDVSHSKKLTHLTPPRPGSFLRRINAKCCSSIETVDLVVHDRCRLTELNLSDCLNLKEVNIHAGRLRSLNLSGCRSLRSVSLNTPTLNSLKAAKCRRLQILGADIQKLQCPKLKHLSLNACREIQDEGLNLFLRNLKLESLNVGGCIRLTQVAVAFQEVENCTFDAYGCGNLKALEIRCQIALQQVVLKGCSNLEKPIIVGPSPKVMKM